MAGEIVIDLESGEELPEVKEKPVTQEVPENENDKDETLVHEDDDEHTESGTDGELTNAADDEEREAIRERRREERKNRKIAQREREEALRRELASRDAIINDLRSRVDQIDNRASGSELAQLENAKKQLSQNYNYFKDQIRIATEAGNGTAVADATEKLIQTQRKLDQVGSYEQGLRSRQTAPKPLDPRMINHAQNWMSRNAWYNPAANDQDSRILATLDNQVAADGFDPSTPNYWEELDARAKKYLPHRYQGGKVAPVRPKSVVTGSGRESGGAAQGNKNSYVLSAERVQALKDAGVWDDPKKRADAVKRFREFDKQNPSR